MAVRMDWKIPKEGVVWAAKHSSSGLSHFSAMGMGMGFTIHPARSDMSTRVDRRSSESLRTSSSSGRASSAWRANDRAEPDTACTLEGICTSQSSQGFMVTDSEEPASSSVDAGWCKWGRPPAGKCSPHSRKSTGYHSARRWKAPFRCRQGGRPQSAWGRLVKEVMGGPENDTQKLAPLEEDQEHEENGFVNGIRTFRKTQSAEIRSEGLKSITSIPPRLLPIEPRTSPSGINVSLPIRRLHSADNPRLPKAALLPERQVGGSRINQQLSSSPSSPRPTKIRPHAISGTIVTYISTPASYSSQSSQLSSQSTANSSSEVNTKPSLPIFANELWYQKASRTLTSQRTAWESAPDNVKDQQYDPVYTVQRLNLPTASARYRQATPVSASTPPSGPASGCSQKKPPSRLARREEDTGRFRGNRSVNPEELREIVGRLSTCDPARVPDSGRSRYKGKGFREAGSERTKRPRN